MLDKFALLDTLCQTLYRINLINHFEKWLSKISLVRVKMLHINIKQTYRKSNFILLCNKHLQEHILSKNKNLGSVTTDLKAKPIPQIVT